MHEASIKIRPRIALTRDEILQACDIGAQRNCSKIFREPRILHGYGGMRTLHDGWSMHVSGAIGEMAVFKWLELPPFPHGVGRFQIGRDVGAYEVRATAYADGVLPLLPELEGPGKDKDDVIFIFVNLYQLPVAVIKGWIRCKDGRREEWFGKLRPNYKYCNDSWNIPADCLNPMDTLPKE